MRLRRLRKRGDMPIEFFEGLILTIALVMAFLFFVPKCTSEQEEDKFLKTYNNLYEIITTIQPNELKSMGGIFAEDSSIMGFSNDGDFRQVLKENGYMYYYIDRPGGCKEGYSCLCYCIGIGLDESTNPPKVPCEEGYICRPIESGVDFFNETTPHYESNFPEAAQKFGFVNGFILARTGEGIYYRTLNTRLNERHKSLYIERYKHYVDVCEKTPCFSEEEKRVIDDRTKK